MKTKATLIALSIGCLAVAQTSKWDVNGNNVSNTDYFGTNNNKNLVLKTNGTTRGVFDKDGGFTNTGLITTDTLSILGGARIKGRLHVGQNSMWFGSVGFGATDDITSTNGNINLGGESPLPFSQIKVGIGLNTPNQMLHLHNSLLPSNLVRQQFTNLTTTAASGRGFLIGILANANANLHQQELNKSITITTNGGFTGVNSNFPIGTTFNPQSLFHINDGANQTDMQITNNATGVTATDGFKLGITNTGIAQIKQQENLPLQFHTNNTQRAVILANGRFGINTIAPSNRLQITSATGDAGFGGVNGSSGLRFTNLTSVATPLTNPTTGVLSVDALGNVIWVKDDNTGSGGGTLPTAQNGLNTSVASPFVELGGTLIRQTQVDMNSNNMLWNGIGQFGIGDNILNPASIGAGLAFEINTGTYQAGQKISNLTPGGVYGSIINVSGISPIFGNVGQEIRVSNGKNHYGLDVATIGNSSTDYNEGVISLVVDGNKLFAGNYKSQTGSITNIAYGVYSQLDVNGTPTYFTRHAASASLISGVSNGTKYSVIGATDLNNNDKNIGVAGLVGFNGAYGYDICDGVNIKNIGVFGGFSNSSLAPAFYKTVAGNYAGYFDGDVEVAGNLTVMGMSVPSDATLKTNIDTITNAMNIINQLKPKQFYYDSTKHFLSNITKKQYGLLAQDVELILPELIGSYGVADKKDTLGNVISAGGTFKNLNYTALFGILIKGIQEQQRTIENYKHKDSLQEARLLALESAVSSCCSSLGERKATAGNISSNANQLDVELSDKDAIVLNQNVPNPFAEQTSITYNVPASVTKAQILFYNGAGQIIQTVDIKTRGKGKVNVFASDLSSGLYHYTLVADGKVVDSKKMVRE